MIHTTEIDGSIKSTPSKLQRTIVLEMIGKWQRILKLEHWLFGISTQLPHEKNDMEIVMTPTRQHSALRIHPRCWNYSEARFEKTLIHEMLHPLFDPIEREHERVVDKAHYQDNYHHIVVETTLDHIANSLYDLGK